jgi:hypothetical protein
MHTNRRANVRKAVRWPIHVLGSSLCWIEADVVDVSTTGVFVHPDTADGLPKTDTQVTLSMFPRGVAHGITTKGRIRWSEASSVNHRRGVGIEFDQPVTLPSH